MRTADLPTARRSLPRESVEPGHRARRSNAPRLYVKLGRGEPSAGSVATEDGRTGLDAHSVETCFPAPWLVPSNQGMPNGEWPLTAGFPGSIGSVINQNSALANAPCGGHSKPDRPAPKIWPTGTLWWENHTIPASASSWDFPKMLTSERAGGF